MKKKILIIDDESLIRGFISSFFQTTDGYQDCKIDVAVDGEEGIAKIKENKYDLIFTDLKMPNKTGLDVLKFVSEHSPKTDTVLLTAYGGGDSAKKAMAYGAYEYITKPIEIDELELIIKRIFERRDLIAENESMHRELQSRQLFPKMISGSKSMQEIMELLNLVAPTSSTVLITGESGTGKELVAEAIHHLSPRKKNNYVRINCAALPEHLIESELFGFEKGAFTGAIKRTRGKFELADGGSILLDEISEMNLDLQAKLLRVLQEKEVVRIGSENPVKIDTRVIATSNRDLAEEIKNGTFREDLFFRLNIVPIHLPPLRERKSDIPPLVEKFVKKIAFEVGVGKKSIKPEVIDLLMKYDWPGNIRELQNAVERAMITTRKDVLDLQSFSFLRVDGFEIKETPITFDVNTYDGMTLAQIEKDLIFRTLDKTGNNKTETAKILGITTRTLRNKLHQYEQED
jgi:DNA-binding NtrC family response regulator